MIRVFNKFLTVICCLVTVIGVQQAMAQAGEDSGTVTTVLTPHSNDGIFNSEASYTYEVTRHLQNSRRQGKISYIGNHRGPVRR